MPDPVLVDVDVINRALGRIGAGVIQARDEDTDLAAQVKAVYDDTVDNAFASYQWKWARRTRALDALAPPAPVAPATIGTFNGWPAAFAFPADALSQPLGLYRSWPSETLRHFAVEGRTVYAREQVLFGTFILRQAPDQWPPGFRAAVATWLAAELCIPVTHDKDLAEQLMQAAVGAPSEGMRGGLMGRAIAFDLGTGGSTASAMQDDVITHARYEGSWWGGGPW